MYKDNLYFLLQIMKKYELQHFLTFYSCKKSHNNVLCYNDFP